MPPGPRAVRPPGSEVRDEGVVDPHRAGQGDGVRPRPAAALDHGVFFVADSVPLRENRLFSRRNELVVRRMAPRSSGPYLRIMVTMFDRTVTSRSPCSGSSASRTTSWNPTGQSKMTLCSKRIRCAAR